MSTLFVSAIRRAHVKRVPVKGPFQDFYGIKAESGSLGNELLASQSFSGVEEARVGRAVQSKFHVDLPGSATTPEVKYQSFYRNVEISFLFPLTASRFPRRIGENREGLAGVSWKEGASGRVSRPKAFT